jgi:hypothetical protein
VSRISIKCYHSTSIENAQNIIQEMFFKSSRDSGKLRLGVGTYFFVSSMDQSYAMDCARELERFQVIKGKHGKEYAILSFQIECDESSYLDLCDPVNMGVYHRARYELLKTQQETTPGFEFKSAAAIDAYVLGIIRERYNIHVVKCQEYFGMFQKEEEIKCNFHQKTLIPNVIMACADPETVQIKDICIAERGEFSDESTNCI